MKRLVSSVSSALLPVVALATGLAPASAQGIWPERAQNLQVLPEDFPPQRLRAVMLGFTQALGVDCSHCHVGVEGEPLSTFDFPSDENPNKDRARAMYRMLGTINAALGAIEPSGPERVNMWCTTCHNGKARPQSLAEAVMETFQAEGGDAALARFAALRAEYFGAAAYDFTAGSVNGVGSQLYQAGDTATALRFFERNVEDYPDYAEGWESMGDVWAARGDRERAIGFYEKALELAPGHPRIQRSLDAIRSEG
jgi:tetratricopeptide (TPR) repeat protein